MMSRHYCIKISLKIECEERHCSHMLVKVNNIDIAEDHSRQEYRSLQQPNSHCGDYFVQFECTPQDQFETSKIASTLYSRISTLDFGDFKFHSTSAFSVDEDVGAATWYEVATEKVTKKISRSDLLNGFDTKDGLLRCELLIIRNDPSSVRAGFVMYAGGVRILNSPPWDCATTCGPSLSSPLSPNSKSLKGQDSLNYLIRGLHLSFLRLKTVELGEDHNIVVPGTKLRKCLKIQLIFSDHKTQKISSSCVLKRPLISLVKIEIGEVRIRTYTSPREVWTRTHEVKSKKCKHTLKCDQSEELVPTSLYRCQIPDLDPSCYSSQFFRSYTLKVEVQVKQGKRIDHFIERLPISIAYNTIEKSEKKQKDDQSKSN